MVEAAGDRAEARRRSGQAEFTVLLSPDVGDEGVQSGGVRFASRLKPAVLACARQPSSHVGMPNYVGLVQVPAINGERRSTWFESLNEWHHFMDVQLTRPVVSMVAQPARVVWRFSRGIREHWPDALVEVEGGRRILIDVTRRQRLDEAKALAIFTLTAETAAAAGWEYQVRTEMPPQRARNLRWLWAHRCEDVPAGWNELVASRPSEPCTVDDAAQQLGGGPVGWTRLWRLVAHQMAWLDLNRPLTLASEVRWHNPSGKDQPSWIVTL